MANLRLIGGAIIFENPNTTGPGTKFLDKHILQHAGHLGDLGGSRQDFRHMLQYRHLMGATAVPRPKLCKILGLLRELPLSLHEFGQNFLPLPPGRGTWHSRSPGLERIGRPRSGRIRGSLRWGPWLGGIGRQRRHLFLRMPTLEGNASGLTLF